MSYPYDLDVVFNSEQAADSIGRLSFGTSSGGGSGDKILFRTEPFSMNVGTGFGTDETVTVIAAFSNPVGITLDELVGFVYTIENNKLFTTSIHDTNWNTELRAEVPGNYQDPDFQFPVTLIYNSRDSSISVQADIYTLDGNRPSTPITLGSMQKRSVNIIKKT